MMQATQPEGMETNLAEAQPAPDTQPAPEAQPNPDPATLAAAVLRAVSERTQRAEHSVIKSMAEQRGLSEGEVRAALEQARAQATEAAPAATQPQPAAQERLIAAEVKWLGAEMGLIDPEAALRLMDASLVQVEADGTVSGVREALTALAQHKSYLFASPGRGAWAQKLGAGAPPALTGVEEAFYRRNPGLRKT